ALHMGWEPDSNKHPGLIVMEAFDHRAFDIAAQYMHDSITVTEVPTKETFSGKDGITSEFQRWLGGCPDAVNNIYSFHQTSDTVYMEGVWTGTHTGDLVFPDATFKPTGKLIKFEFITVAT